MSKNVKDVIKAYLDKRAATDSLFAAAYANTKKNINDCFNFILGEARKRGNAVCMTDAEVFGLAVHYYDEADLKVEDVSAYEVVASVSAPEVPAPKPSKPIRKKHPKRDENQGMQSLFDFG